MMPEVAGRYAIGEKKEAVQQVNQSIRLSMFICIPYMVGLTVLSYPIMGVLFPTSTDLAAKLLLAGSVFAVTDSFSIITGGALQAIGQQRRALFNAAASLVINVISLALMLVAVSALDIYAVMLANILFSVVCCILNVQSMKKYLHFKGEIRKTYMEPFLASAIMGVAAYAIYQAVFSVTKRPSIALLVAILLAVIVYLILYVVISHTKEEEMLQFPMGRHIVRILHKIRIYK